MKKVLIGLMVFAMLLCGSNAFADWLITASWTHSVGPNLSHEIMYIDGVQECEVQAADAPSCTFTRTGAQLTGQVVTVIAYNVTGQPSQPLTIGVLNEPQAPAAPTGGTLIFQWQ